MNVTPDGDYQTYKAESGAYVRENFFGRDPRALELVKDLSDDQVWGLKRGGHDYRKVYAAFDAALSDLHADTVALLVVRGPMSMYVPVMRTLPQR